MALLLTLPLNVAAAERKGSKAKSGLPNSFAQDYKLDKHLSERSGRSRNLLSTVETVDLIVTLKKAKEQLPTAFRRYVCGPRLDIINGYALCKLPVSQLKGLSQFGSVHRLHHNREARETDLLSTAAVQAEKLTKQYGYSGAGVTVAFIDSGLTNADHPDLKDRNVLKFVDFVNDDRNRHDEHGEDQSERADYNGHGTHVIGIVAGNGSGDSRFSGIAPGTKIVSLKVLDSNGKGSIGEIIAAMDWVAKNHKAYNIRIVNMSVGAGVYESYWTDPLTLAAKVLVDKGITVVAAAGNFGKNREGELQWGGITSPGVAPWVLTACAFNTHGTQETEDDVVAGFSSSGPTAIDFTAKPDICAPGVGIVSIAAPESQLYRRALLASSGLLGDVAYYRYSPYLSLTGTSQAAPFVTGTVALMLQANPSLTPNLIKAILQYTASYKTGVSPLRQGAGFMNAEGAVTLASFYAHAQPGLTLPVDPSWSTHIIWGNYLLSGGVLDPSGNAWMPGVEWGWAKTQGDDGDNIVWGTACGGDDCDNIVWGTSDDGDNIVWGTSDDSDNIVWGTADDGDNIVWGTSDDGDNIVWGTSDDGDNIVWGTDCGGDDCDNIVWGAADDADNIVWGTADDGDNIVWGTGDDADNIVWGTADDADNIVWGTSVLKNIIWPINQLSSKGGK